MASDDLSLSVDPLSLHHIRDRGIPNADECELFTDLENFLRRMDAFRRAEVAA